MAEILNLIWHHVKMSTDVWPHTFGKPADCWCEPEVDRLGSDGFGIEHKVVRHQDLTAMSKEGIGNG